MNTASSSRRSAPFLLFTGALALLVPLTVTATASADVVPPDVEACDQKSPGDACTLPTGGGTGRCATLKCTRRDYGNWDRDASSSPPEIQVDCVKCVALGAADRDGASTTRVDSGTSEPEQSTSGTSNDDGGCSVALVRSAGPYGIALVPAAILALARRRRSRSTTKA